MFISNSRAAEVGWMWADNLIMVCAECDRRIHLRSAAGVLRQNSVRFVLQP